MSPSSYFLCVTLGKSKVHSSVYLNHFHTYLIVSFAKVTLKRLGP